MKWYWYIGILLLMYWIWNYSKTVKRMMKLQKLAQAYPIEFRLFVKKEEGWEVFERDHDGKGCIKLIPDPQITTEYYYYIKWSGRLNESTAIDDLIKNFQYYIHNIRKM